VLHSISRLTSQLSTPVQLAAARKIREALSTYEDSKDLIELGAYTQGSNPKLDAAVRMQPEIAAFLRQDTTQDAPLVESIAKAQAIAAKL
jgi:flagellum-specific ATP synthase